ncbi:PTS transporter subunit EIIB [Bacillus sp. 165]|nr:PTS transporter subunit EIIB [Bacillus sp. 165]
MGIHHGFGFSAGAIDYFLNYKLATKPILLIPIGLAFGVIYFIVFYFLIRKLDLKTPGREDDVDMDEEESAQHTSTSVGASYLAGLGGKENITEVDNCATRLRLTVKDAGLIDEAALKKAGAKGVKKLNNTSVQVIVGTNVEFVAEEMKKLV